MQIVEEQDDVPLRRFDERWRGVSGSGWRERKRSAGIFGSGALLDAKSGNDLRLLALKDFEIVLGQIADDAPLRIADDHRNEHGIDGDLDFGSGVGSRYFAILLCRCAKSKSEDGAAEQSSRSVSRISVSADPMILRWSTRGGWAELGWLCGGGMRKYTSGVGDVPLARPRRFCCFFRSYIDKDC